MAHLRSLATALVVVTCAGSAAAQGEAPAPAPAPAPVAPAEKPVAPAPVATTPAPATSTTTSVTTSSDAPADAKDEGATDFSKIVGRVGVAYFGGFEVPLGFNPQPVTTQMIGVRYFFSDRMGIDVGLGFALNSGSTENKAGTTTTKQDEPSTLGFSLKAGLPIVMTSSKHYAFFFEPQALFGYAGRTVKPIVPPGGTAPPDTKHTGNRFVVGGAAGAMVQFGFIGIPQLAIDATIGLGIDLQSSKTEAPSPADNSTVTNSRSSTTVSTLSGNQPWNIFHSNLNVVYFF